MVFKNNLKIVLCSKSEKFKNVEAQQELGSLIKNYSELEVEVGSRGLAVMHSTQTHMVLGSRPNAGHWWRQEGHPVLNARVRTKVLSEAPSKPQLIGGNGGKIETKEVEVGLALQQQYQ